jgi:serine/threonine protein kinase/tetratricopeptide (TPR) repeat protein
MSREAEVANGESKIVGTCATCGRPLTQVGPKGECLRCLASLGFLNGSQPAHDFTAHGRITPGPLKYDHFEVETGADGFPVELGAGAMAITYRARDTVLNSVVALKVIDRKVAQAPGARSRFLREARAAAQIRHPNVARVSHYGEQDGECFYVMELVEGETLEAQVRREGPMPLAWALEIIEQVARALAAAEACGVVHRDIKPSNIMLECDPGGTPIVKVIDYGVAKVLAPDALPGDFQTQPGFIGTPAFASPEQFAPSNSTKIDTRSDIYSLGVTLWYLLTGRTPFVGSTMEAIRTRQTEYLPLHQLKGLHIPARCVALLKSMLAPDPNDRPRSARELLSAIHRCFMRFNTEARARRKRFVLAATGLGLAITATAITVWLQQRTRSSAEMERSIAVLPFENLSPNGEDAYFAVGMQDEITSGLAQLARIRVIGPQSTRSYVVGKDRNYSVIGRQLGVRHLLEGNIRKESGEMRVSLRLVDTRDANHEPWTKTYERPIADVFALQSEITRGIATKLQAQLSPDETSALDRPPTTDLEAYDLYLQARAIPIASGGSGALSGSTATLFSNTKRAIALLNRAVARDPNFVLAYCELATLHDELYFQRHVGPEEELAIDHRSLAEVALEKARRLQPDSGAVHRHLAIHALQINRDPQEAALQIQQARLTLPNDAQVESIAGRVARRQDEWEEALRCFERAVVLEPRDVNLRVLLANTARSIRRYQDFDREVANAIALTPSDKSGALSIDRAVGQLEASGDMTRFRADVAALKDAHQLEDSDIGFAEIFTAVWSHDAAGIARVISGKHEQVSFNGINYPDALFMALAARIRGDDSAARAAFAKARPEMEKTVLAGPTDGPALSILAIIDAGLGDKGKAVEEAKRACDLSSYKTNNLDATTVHANLAAVYAWTGETDLAISELDELANRPAASHAMFQVTYGDLDLNPYWDPLRENPRFTAIMKRLAPVASK